MKILIVEDNLKMRRMLCEYVGEKFEQIFECGNGSEASGLYRKHLPDWVLMDIEMPETDGITATRQIIVEFPEANICIVTAFDDGEIRRETLAAGAKGFVVKDDLPKLRKILNL